MRPNDGQWTSRSCFQNDANIHIPSNMQPKIKTYQSTAARLPRVSGFNQTEGKAKTDDFTGN